MDFILDLFEDLFVHITGRAIEDAYDHGTPKRRKAILLIAALVGIPLLLALLIVGIIRQNGGAILCTSLLLLFLILWLTLKIREYRRQA